MNIRLMEERDIEEVSAIEERSFSMPWKADDFREMIRATYAFYYVAEEDGKILGTCGLRNLCGEGEITNVAVDLPYRNRGVAKALLSFVLEMAPAHGIGDITLEVRAGNEAAIALYEGAGFEKEGIRPNFYEHPAEDALIMWRRIHTEA